MMRRPRLLVLQHLDVEHPGVFRDFLRADGISWDTVELDRGEAIPSLARYDALWVFGGPMDVWEEAAYPWLVPEKAAIRHWVESLQRPFLGICLGHQLLAAALGGEVGRGTAEVGILDVELTPAGRASPYFAGLPSTLRCLQWHGAEVWTPPPGTEVLAASGACAVQAMRCGEHALGAQFHVEVTGDTVAEWGAVPAYAAALDAALGAGALARFDAEVAHHMSAFMQQARRFYDNWMSVAGFAARQEA